MGEVYNVRLEPVGVEFEVQEDETILDAAFRQGIALPHGCKEGQCSACKCIQLDGETELLKHSTFALSEFERESGHILMCCTLAYSDIEIELLNFDEELLSKSIPVKIFDGKIVDFTALTHDIYEIEIEIDTPMKFWAGQYVDITVPMLSGESITRSFSLANSPDEGQKLSFIIKKYPDGRFSGELESGGIQKGAGVSLSGPYGMCFRREDRQGPVILVGAGSGMSPIWSILNDQLASGEDRPILFFYGARTQDDLFKLNEIEEITKQNPSVEFVPVLSHADDDTSWTGERGFVHECVASRIKAMDINGEGDVYACGPPPMIDALTPVLYMNDFETDRIFIDKFTPTSGSSSVH